MADPSARPRFRAPSMGRVVLWIGVAFCLLVGWRFYVVFQMRAHRNALEATGWTLEYWEDSAPPAGTAATSTLLDWFPQAASLTSQFVFDDPDIASVYIPADSDADLGLLSGIETVRTLSIHREHLSEADVEQIASLSSLEMLHLSSDEIDDERLTAITTTMPALYSLTIASQRVTDAGLAELRLPELVILDVQATRATGVGLQPESIPELGGLELGQLADDAALARAGQIRELRELVVYRGRVSDAGLRSLRNLAHLESLIITGPTRLTDQGVASLSEITSLQHVELDGQLLTFAAVESLSELPRLHSLSLRSGNLDDAGLDAFHPGPELLRLELHGTSISDAAFERFEEQFPEVTVWR